MKYDFRHYLVIFLVVLLGGFLGVYGGLTLYHYENPQSNVTEALPSQPSHPSLDTPILPAGNNSTLKEGIKTAYDSVVEITAQTGSLMFGQRYARVVKGSGVIISEDGYIVTNEHVISGAETIEVKDSADQTYEATLIGSDSQSDLAVIKIEATDLKAAQIADSSTLELGDVTIVIGNPLGNGISVSDGIISALNKPVTLGNETMYLIQTNAAVNQGNSGGGLFDIKGQLIGIVNAKSGNTDISVSVEGLGYAIPSNTVIKICDDLMANGYVKNRATLGVTISQLDQDISGFPKGLYITEVIDDSSADQAGLEVYDRIIKLNDTDVSTINDLRNILNQLSVGDTVPITVIRNNSELTLDITLQEGIQR